MVCDTAAAAIEEQTARRLYWTKKFCKKSVWQISQVCAAQKDGPGWIG